MTLLDGGIYAITHLETARRYAGQTSNVARRLAWHRARLRIGRHHNKVLQRDWDVYGADAFVFEVISRFKSERDFSTRHRDERLLIASGAPELSYNLLNAHERRHDEAGSALVSRVVKLPLADWSAFDEEFGMEWLRKLIDRAKPPK